MTDTPLLLGQPYNKLYTCSPYGAILGALLQLYRVALAEGSYMAGPDAYLYDTDQVLLSLIYISSLIISSLIIIYYHFKYFQK